MRLKDQLHAPPKLSVVEDPEVKLEWKGGWDQQHIWNPREK